LKSRLDKWLWCARFYRTRVLAQEACARGAIRVNGSRTEKAHFMVGPGDVLTFAQGSAVRVVRLLGVAERRGSAPEAATLYEYVPAEAPPSAAQRSGTDRRDRSRSA